MSLGKQVGRFAAVSFEFIASIFAGFFVGRWLDRHLDTRGWLTWVGLAVGTFAAFRALFVTARVATRELEKEDREKPPTSKPPSTPKSDREPDPDIN